MPDTEYHSSGKSKYSFQVGVDVLNLLFLNNFLKYFSAYRKC